jgi:hypothetical protein
MMAHQFLLGAELLLRRGLLSDALKPIGLCPLIERLHYHEPGNLFLVDLLQTGTLQTIAARAPTDAKAAESILHIVCHLFNRHPLPARCAGTSLALDPLPEEARAVHVRSTALTLELFLDYLAHFVSLEGTEAPRLPFSGIELGRWTADPGPLATAALMDSGAHVLTNVRSAFFAVQGNGDDFGSVQELTSQMAEALQVCLCRSCHFQCR